MELPPLDYATWRNEHGQQMIEQGIERLLAVGYPDDHDGIEIAAWFGRPRPDLGGRTPRGALADGDEETVYKVAALFAAASFLAVRLI